MSAPFVALLTDFGTSDHYVGAMKGVALGICPSITFIDLTHDLPPFDIVRAATELEAAYRYLPAGTVFLVVVDPGVGSVRRPIAAEAGPYRFVAPDNGVLSLALNQSTGTHVVELSEARYARPTVSPTFEGRDRFAPAAAWLAHGTPLSALGSPLTDWCRLTLPEPVELDGKISGEILRVDRFGNLVTNIDRAAYERFCGGGRGAVEIGAERIEPVVTTYADVGAGSLCALFGSSDRLEVAVSGGSAAKRLRLDRGAPIVLTRA
jgi:S-adenosylmethionine hydrolase